MKQRFITRAQQLQEQEVREAVKRGERVPETLTEGSCSGPYLALFDGDNKTGNEICFVNNGSSTDFAYLPNYCESYHFPLCNFWDPTHIKSWDTGGQAAAMAAGDGNCAPSWLNMPANSCGPHTDFLCGYPDSFGSTLKWVAMSTSTTAACPNG